MLCALDSYHCATLLTTPYCGDRVLIVCIIRWIDSQACVLHQLLSENRFQSVAMIICPDSLVFNWYETLCEYTNLKVGVFSSWRYPFLNKRQIIRISVDSKWYPILAIQEGQKRPNLTFLSFQTRRSDPERAMTMIISGC